MRSGVAAFAALCIVGALVGPFAAQAAHAASTFVVNTTSDHAPDGCVVAPGDCTLREAITAANSATGSTIQFSIGGGGLQTIQPTSDLPTLNVTTTIDATTQPGYTGTPLIELDGTLVTTGNKIGLWVFGADSMIEGLVINRFGVWDLLIDASGNTIRANYIGTNAGGTAKSGSPNFGAFGVRGADNVVGGTSASDRNVIVGGLTISNNGAHGNVVQGNYIGTNAAGTADINDNYNLFITAGASNNTIGGTAAGAGNVISGSSSNGMQIDLNDSGNIVQGNYIGTNAAGNGAVGNNGAGILLYGSNNTIGGTTAGAGNVLSGNAEGIRVQGVGNTIQGNRVGVGPNGEVLGNTGVGVNVPSSEGHDNTIGGTAAGAANTIANNALAGVAVSTGVGNALEGNSIFDNGALGIDLDQNGLTPNDAGDGDNGGNHRQNFPVITGAAASGTGTHVSGTLDSAAGTYRVEVFSNPTCDASGYGEARTVLGAATGVAPGSFVTDVATTTVGSFATATATNEATGDTSELSQCFAVTAAVSDPPSWTVNTSADHDDGACTVADCTLREAINRANVDAATDTIAFSIPGAGVHTIQPTTDLPHLTQPVVVDATTQPGYSGAPLVELDGSLDTGADKIGLWIITNNSTIAGLAINRFVNRGILVNESASGNTIRANYVGTTADGTAASGNFAFQAVEVRGANNVVGGLSAADRNVIVDGVYVNYFGLGGASDNVVEGNFIGTNAAGTAALGGIGMQVGKATNTTIGGTDPGATNLISGNAGNGIEVNSNAVGTVIRRNLVGTNIFGTAAVPNTSAGMQIYGPGTVIGGTAIGVGNYVSGNSGDGIRLQTDHAVVQGNQIGVAVGGGALGNGGAGVSMIGLESHDNTVGGTTEGAGNTIANNGSDGVSVINGAGHTIEGNSISGNTGLGIDINNDGVTPNDAGDGDNGQNNRQNFPVITSATAGAPGSIAGTLDTTAGSFRVEVFKNVTCDASAHGEGATYLGSVATSNGTFNLAAAVDAGDIVTATATAPDGSTSEFSGCFTVTEPPVDGPSWTVNTADDHDDHACTLLDCTLREAINRGNDETGPDTISFAIPGAGVHTITPASALPVITDPVVIDGSTQPGYSGTPVVELDGTQASIAAGPTGAIGLRITAGNSTVRALAINRFTGLQRPGIRLETAGGNVLEGNFIGTDPAGTVARPNDFGVEITFNSPNNRIGGTAPGTRNVISGNVYGIEIQGPSSGNVVEGNFIGTDVTGTLAIANNRGISVFGNHNTIGGTSVVARNVISGNTGDAVAISFGTGNVVQGNFIGTDVTGTIGLGAPSSTGVEIDLTAFDNLIGGTTPGARNLISGSRDQIVIRPGSADNRIEGNFIGTDASGSAIVAGQRAGIWLDGALTTVIGGTASGAGNVISGGFVEAGVVVSDGATENTIQGNFVGTDSTGTVALGNGIGVDLELDATDNLVGGTDAAARNVISGNGSGIVASQTSDNTIAGNFIGTDATGTAPLGNTGVGVQLSLGASDNMVGGSDTGAGNVIAFNYAGVIVASGTGNSILGNSIHSNAQLGIDLAGGGVTANDPGDSDGIQNFPQLSSAIAGTPGTIKGTLDSGAGAYRIEFFKNNECDTSGNGEGATYLGSVDTSNGLFTFGTDLTVGDVITATATAPDGSTSEFSACATVVPPSASISVEKSTVPEGSPQSFDFTLRRLFDDVEVGSLSAVRDGDAPDAFVPVDPGAYAVSETLPDLWVQTDAACDNVDTVSIESIDPSALVVASGEHWLCRFTNEQQARIVVHQTTVPPGSAQGFSYSGAHEADLHDGEEFSLDVAPGTTYTAIQAAVPGWDRTIDCVDPSNDTTSNADSATFAPAAGEVVTCTFTNTARGLFTIDAAVAPASPGHTAYWHGTVTNSDTAAGNAILTFTMPAGVTYTGAIGAICTPAAGVVSCDFGLLAPGATASVILATTVHADEAVGSMLSGAFDITDAAGVHHATASFAVPSDSAVTDTTLIVNPSSAFEPGETAGFVLTTTNAGPSSATHVVATLALPQGLNLTTYAIRDQGTTVLGRSCVFDAVLSTLHCDLADLPSGASVQVEVDATVDGVPGTQLTVPASLTSDQDATGVARSVSIAVKGTATLPLYAYSYGAAPGRTAYWSTWLYNTGTSPVTPTINFSVASGAVPTGATGCADVSVDADVVSCTLAPIAGGGYAQPSFSATVNVDTPIGSTVTGHFTVGSTVVDAPFTVPQDLSRLSGYMYPPYGSQAASGDAVSLRWIVQNIGPSTAPDATATMVLPDGLDFVGAQLEYEYPPRGGKSCSYDGGTRTVTCQLGDMGSYDYLYLRVDAAVSAGVGSTLQVSGTLAATNATPVSGSVQLSVVAAQIDMAIWAYTVPYSYSAVGTGDPLTYYITPYNVGNTAARGVVVSGVLPLGVTFESATATHWPQITAPCTYDDGSRAVSCDLGTVASHDSWSIKLVTNAPLDPGAISSTFSVTSVGSDAVPGNNATTISTQVAAASANLIVSTYVSPNPPAEDSPASLYAQVYNGGISPAHDVSLQLTVPADFTPNKVTAYMYDWYTYTGSGPLVCTGPDAAGVISCPIATFAPYAYAYVYVSGAFSTPATRTVSADANAASPSDPDVTNNHATSVFTVTAVNADMRMYWISQRDATIGLQGHQRFTLYPYNYGPSTAQNVVVTATLPANFEVTATGDPDHCVFDAQSVTCTYASWDVGQWKPVTVDATAVASGLYTVHAHVSSDTTSPYGTTYLDTAVNGEVLTTSSSVDTLFTATPPPVTNSIAHFEFAADPSANSNTYFMCSLDGAEFWYCYTPFSWLPADGSHTLDVFAVVNNETDDTPASFTWIEDRTPPDTSISTHPNELTSSTGASFDFSATESGSTFACKLDAAAFAPCTPGVSYSGLGDGLHTFRVRATDPAGNEDPTAATSTWTVDTTPPTVTIAPDAAQVDPTAGPDVHFTVGFSETVAAFSASSITLIGTAHATVTDVTGRNVTVTATTAGSVGLALAAGAVHDLVGNPNLAASGATVFVDPTPPPVPTPTSPANNSATPQRRPSFTWGAVTDPTPPVAYDIQYQSGACDFVLDVVTVTGLANPLYAPSVDLADGAYCWRVRALDGYGHASDWSVASHFSVDTAAPTVTRGAYPAALDNHATGTFTFSATDPAPGTALVVKCSLDSAVATVCSSPVPYSVTSGAHTFVVTATDAAGNVGTDNFAWTVDAVRPTVTVNQAVGQADPTTTPAMHFTVDFSEPVSDFAGSDVTLTGTAPASVTAVTPTGPDTYDVTVTATGEGTVISSIAANRATDAAGNGNTASTSTDDQVTLVFTATGDALSTFRGVANSVNVLANDHDLDNEALQVVTGAHPGSHGSASCTTAGVCTYTPTPATYVGPDSFQYIVADPHGNQATATVSVQVVDRAVITVTGAAVPEGNAGTSTASATVTVTGTVPAGLSVKVNAATANGTATVAGNDYVGVGATTLTFTAAGSQGFPVTIKGDVTPELDETFAVNLSAAVNGTIAGASATMTILNDEPANVPPVANSDSLGTLRGVANSINVLANDTDANLDALTVVAGTHPGLHGSASCTAAGVCKYTPANSTYVGSDSFTYVVSDPLGSTATGTVSVQIDNLPVITVAGASVAEGNAGTSTASASVTVTGSVPAGLSVKVNAATANGTATVAGNDYVAVGAKTLTFTTPGVQSFPVTIKGDTLAEPNETFVVNLSAPVNGTISGTSAAMTIQNDDPPDVPPVANPDALETLQGVARTVNVLANDSDPGGETITFSAVTIAPTHGSVTCPAGACKYTPAGTYTGSDSFTYRIADPHGTTTTATVSVQVYAKPVFSIAGTTVTEGGPGTTAVASLNVTLTGTLPSGMTATVKAATANGVGAGAATTANLDYQARPATALTFAAVGSQAFTVNVNGDANVEPNEVFRVVLSVPTNGTLNAAATTANVTITNDD